jgi:uncharacterized OB-fold protein
MSEEASEEASGTITEIIAPCRLDYTIAAGEAQRPFLHGLAGGKIMGQRCPRCSKVYMPPRGSCPTCAIPTEEEVEVSDHGTITTFCIVNLQFYGQAVEVPYACCSILLDGSDLPFFHLVQEVPADQVRMGLRVKAVWAPEGERKPSIESVRFFKPSGEEDAPYDSYKEFVS